MNTVCLKRFLNSANLEYAEKVEAESQQNCQRTEKWFRAFLLTVSFLVFGFLIGPQVQSSFPRTQRVALALQSRARDINRQPVSNDKTKQKRAAKTALVLGFVTASLTN